MVRDFATAEIGPHVSEWDENQIFPLETIKKAGELGFLGAIFPEELGGAGLGYIEYSIIVEELARVDPSCCADCRRAQFALLESHFRRR